MRRIALFAVFVLALVATATPAQVRQKKSEAADVPTLLKTAGEQYSAKEFGACVATLKAAIDAARKQLIEELRAAMPDVEGLDKQKPKDMSQAAMFGVNIPFEQRYRAAKDAANRQTSLKITAHESSPVVQMLNTTMALAAAAPDTEVVQYGAHKAMFKKNSATHFTMQLILWGKHLITVDSRHIAEELFFKIFSQAWVDKIAALLPA